MKKFPSIKHNRRPQTQRCVTGVDPVRSTNVDLMLARRLRRRPNIKSALDKRILLFAGLGQEMNLFLTLVGFPMTGAWYDVTGGLHKWWQVCDDNTEW